MTCCFSQQFALPALALSPGFFLRRLLHRAVHLPGFIRPAGCQLPRWLFSRCVYRRWRSAQCISPALALPATAHGGLQLRLQKEGLYGRSPAHAALKSLLFHTQWATRYRRLTGCQVLGRARLHIVIKAQRSLSGSRLLSGNLLSFATAFIATATAFVISTRVPSALDYHPRVQRLAGLRALTITAPRAG